MIILKCAISFLILLHVSNCDEEIEEENAEKSPD